MEVEKKILWPLALVSILILSGLSWRQAGYWKNSEILFKHTITVTENNSSIHYNLANVFAEKND